MSVDARELDRAALQRKDREQLQAIATAMGRKPPSRARKDQIIDLILELAGGGEPVPASERPRSGGNGSGAPAEEAGEKPEQSQAPSLPFDAPRQARVDAGTPPAPESEAASRRPNGPRTSQPATDNGTPATDVDRSDRVVHVASFSPFDEGAGASAATAAGPDQDHREAGERERADGTAEDRDRGQFPGGDGQGEREGGGRRRRRRGRDKERATQPAGQPGQQPSSGGQPGAPAGGPGSEEAGAGAGALPADAVSVAGYLDLRDEGYGFLRLRGYLPSKEDVYVPAKFVRQFGLRRGDHVAGMSRPAGRGEKNPALLRVDAVGGADPEESRARRRFEDLTPLFPDERLRLETPGDPLNMTARIIDLISPIGKGQRGLIVSPPKAGKTTVMKTVAQCIEANNPEVKLIVLLVDERPEEVTDMRRSVRGEVVASTFDRPADEHTHVAEMTLERAKRMVEQGEDVVIILDGITRLARAYNLAAPATGRIMSGGIDTGALYPPKKFFGAARNIEEGGSLTILATALVETGSRMDEVIFEEFKGTGNMELRLDRRAAEKRIYPAIDVDASSTRHEELLFERRQLQMVWKLRRVLSGLAEGGAGGGLELLTDRMKTFKSNDEFLAEVAKAPSM